MFIVNPKNTAFINSNGYIIIIEPTKTGYSAFCPDLESCISVGKTVEQTKKYMEEAIELYIEELIEMGEKIPEPKNFKEHINALSNSNTDAYIIFIPIQTDVVHVKSA
jgi:predicted RNase H-like HicB family nuclease